MSESLEESAAAYTKATAKKCILEKVDVKTGEESESNVLQVKDEAGYFAWRRAANNTVRMFYNLFFPPPLLLQMQCKLYVFEKTAQSWIERGRGLLRLNDMASTDDGTLQSRLGKSTFKKPLERGKKGKKPFLLWMCTVCFYSSVTQIALAGKSICDCFCSYSTRTGRGDYYLSKPKHTFCFDYTCYDTT